MAMTTCPECSNPVSDAAPSCPKCGFPLATGKPGAQQGSSSKRLPALIIGALLVLGAGGAYLLQSQTAPQAPASPDAPAPATPTQDAAVANTNCAVTASQVGNIMLGMTFAQAKEASKGAKFRERPGTDGVPTYHVSLDSNDLMDLYPLQNPDDYAEHIRDTMEIRLIHVSNPLCTTPEGIGPGTRLQDAEKHWGRVVNINLSEIESHKTVTFEHAPPSMHILAASEGITFPEGQSNTRQFQPEAKIWSLSIRKPPENTQ